MSETRRRKSLSRLVEAIGKEDVLWLLHLLKETEATQDELNDALHAATRAGQCESVRLLLAAGASLDSVNTHQEPVLVVAVYSGSVEVVRTILQAGYDVSSIGGYTAGIPNPLHLAISSRECPNYEMVGLLLESGVSPECRDIDGDTPLIVACNMGDVELARRLLTVGCKVGSRGYEGNTALHRAVEVGSEEIVELLLQYKADVGAKNCDGNTPLMVACENGNEVLLKILLGKSGKEAVKETNEEGKNCFHLAAIGGNAELIGLLLEAGVEHAVRDNFGNTPLIMSIQTKNSEFARSLLDFISGQKNAKDQVAIQGEQKRSALHWAALHDMLDIVDRLIKVDNDDTSSMVNLLDEAGDTALILAAKSNSHLSIPLLIKHKSDLNIHGELGRTALHWAVQSSVDDVTIEVLLSSAGTDINAVDQTGNTPLVLAAMNGHYSLVLRLSRINTTDLNLKGERGRTVLHWLCEIGQTDSIRDLIAIGRQLGVNITDDNGDTCLFLALKNKHPLTATQLLSSPSSSWVNPLDYDRVDSAGRQALHLASSEGYTDVVQSLVAKTKDANHRDNFGCTPLILSAKNKHEEVMRVLIESGCQVNIADDENRTALFYAAQGNLRVSAERLIAAGAEADLKRSEPSPLIQAAKVGAVEIVKMLIGKGAGVNYHDSQSRTALMWAAQGDYIDIIRELLDQGANARLEDVSGDTALTIAAFNVHPEVVRMIVPVSDLEHREREEGMTALHLAIAKDNKDIVRMLLDAGSEVNALDAKGNNCLLTAMIHTTGSEIVSMILHQCPQLDVNFTGDQGRSALHWAVGDPDCLKMVIERRPDVDLVDIHGASSLLLAIAHSKADSAQILIDAGADYKRIHKDGRAAIHHAAIYGVTQVVELLLSKGVQADTPTEDGKMPILLASVEGHVDIVRLLIQSGSDVNRVYTDSMTPLSVAAGGRKHDVMKVLLEAGADPNLYGSKKCSPLTTAILNNDIFGSAILIQHGAKLDHALEIIKHPIHDSMVVNYVNVFRVLTSVECDVNFLRRLMKEGTIYYFINDDQFLAELRNLSKTPKPLKMLCRSGIRRKLDIPIHEKISHLPVPGIIRDYIAMKDITPDVGTLPCKKEQPSDTKRRAKLQK